MKKFIAMLTVLAISIIFVPLSFAYEATIPNSSFENWEQTNKGLMPKNWTLEYGSVKRILTSSRFSNGTYSVQLSNTSNLYSTPFYVIYNSKTASFKLSANANASNGSIKLFRHVGGLSPVCELYLPRETSKICHLNRDSDGQKFYLTISSQNSTVLVDNISLVQE